MTEFIEWLGRTPPHELVGRIILDGSRLEIGLRVLAEKEGADQTKALKLKISQLLAYLREQGVEPSLLDRCFAAIENRNLVAHGTWMNLLGKGEALIKPDREKPGYKGQLISDEKLGAWAAELGELADAIQERADK